MEAAAALKAVILLVEDDQTIQEVLEAELRDAGFDVLTASSGSAAVALIDGVEQKLRGIVTDIEVGEGADGWTVARTAREAYPGLPVVYMSGGRSQEWTSQGVPGSVLVEKPFVPVQIVTALATLMNAAASPSQD